MRKTVLLMWLALPAAGLPAGSGGMSFDFFSIFTAAKRRKTRERIRTIENY